MRRFVGRHRIGVAMTVLLCASILTSAVVAIVQARALAVERDRARLQASRAERASELIADLFRLAEPGPGSQDITARQLLDRGTSRIAAQLAGDPAMQAALFNVVGRLYGNLSLHDAAIEVLQRALDLQRHGQPEVSLTQAETMHWLGELYIRKNEYATAEELLRTALHSRRASDAPASEIAATLEALGRGLSFAGRYEEAGGRLREALEIRRRMPGPPAQLMSALNELAVTIHRLGDTPGAEALFREAADVGRRVTAPSPEKVEGLLHHARLVHRFDRDAAGAEVIYREALGMARAIYVDDHQTTATILGELARGVRDLGRLAAAETLVRDAHAMFVRLYGVRHRESMIASQTLASILHEQGKRSDAEHLLRDALETARALFGAGHPSTLGAMRSLASTLEAQGKFDESLALRQLELDEATEARGRLDVYVAIALAGLGEHALARGDVPLAERSFAQALDIRQQIHPPDHWRIHHARALVGVARLRAGRLAEAERDLVAGYERLHAELGATAVETLTIRRHLEDLYERSNRTQLARQYRSAPR
jgi:eukaryotic-like serine/threonine-protein kinase